MAGQHVGPDAEVEDGEEGRAGEERTQDEPEVARGLEHVEGDIEKDDRLQEVGAKLSERAEVLDRDEDADDRGEHEEGGRDLQGRAEQSSPSGGFAATSP